MRLIWMIIGFTMLFIMAAAHDSNLWWAEWGSSVMLGGYGLYAIGQDYQDRDRRRRDDALNSPRR